MCSMSSMREPVTGSGSISVAEVMSTTAGVTQAQIVAVSFALLMPNNLRAWSVAWTC
jgi:hypothetical protein